MPGSRILMIICFFSPMFAFGWVDSCRADSSSRHNNNLIEIGEAVINLYYGNGYVATVNPNYSYTRFVTARRYFAKVEYYRISISFSHPDLRPPDVMFTDFRTVRLGIGKEFRIKRFLLSPYLCANYRWGFGEDFVASNDIKYSWELISEQNPMKSFGYGIGMKISYVLHKHYSLGFEGNYSYNNEKRRLVSFPDNQDPEVAKFQPNRRYSTLQLKLGYLF